MQILVTGARGKVGAATIHELIEAGHRVTGCDLAPPVYEGGDSGAHYFQADLTDPGDAFAVVRGQDVVIHCAALPEPTRNAPHKVFGNNLMATFNLVEACVRDGRRPARERLQRDRRRDGVRRAARSTRPTRRSTRRSTNRPQDPYALAKVFGEQLMDAAVARSDLRAISIRPSWVQWEGNYERSLGPWLRDPFGGAASESFWSYIDVYDLAHALRLAAESSLDGHEAMYIVVAPTTAPGGRCAELIAHHFGEDVSVARRCRARTRAGSPARRPSG